MNRQDTASAEFRRLFPAAAALTREQINSLIGEASTGKIVLHNNEGLWICNLHLSHKPPPAGFYGEGGDPFEAIEDAARKIARARR